MTKIKTGSTVRGRPGFKVTSSQGFTGSFVNRTKTTKGSVRRLIARNPASGFSALIGTARDILGFTNNPDVPNVTAAPSPRVMSDSRSRRAGTPTGTEHVVNRGTNRRVRKLR